MTSFEEDYTSSSESKVSMIGNKRIVTVLPAYNAALTLKRTIDDIPPGIVDEFILVDDFSQDATSEVAAQMGLTVVRHDNNRGYGGNQKTCYTEALARGADIVVMLHPDYQYSPKLLPALAMLVASGEFDIALGSRVLGSRHPMHGGMPFWKYVANRFLTLAENILLRSKLSEFHTGYRAFSRESLERIPWRENSDDFVFDNQILAQALSLGLRIGELSCPAKYFPEASSINFRRSLTYGLGCLLVAWDYRKWFRKRG
jgi:glycosyltransferase involved in cell wall biosynthesis